jgi:hypothetical protein
MWSSKLNEVRHQVQRFSTLEKINVLVTGSNKSRGAWTKNTSLKEFQRMA